jgi:hypothetical protein
MMAMLVQQRGRDFDFKRLLVEQIDDGFRRRYRLALHQFARGLPQFAACFDFVGVRIGILYQRGRDANFVQQFLLRPRAQLRIHCADLPDQLLQRLGIHVVSRRSCRLLQRFAKYSHFLMRVRKQARNLAF